MQVQVTSCQLGTYPLSAASDLGKISYSRACVQQAPLVVAQIEGSEGRGVVRGVQGLTQVRNVEGS